MTSANLLAASRTGTSGSGCPRAAVGAEDGPANLGPPFRLVRRVTGAVQVVLISAYRNERGAEGFMDQRFDTMQLPDVPDAVAPDGSDVRVLLQLGRGSMAHFELGAGRVSRAVAHHSVEEIWYILAGAGQMWRRQGERQDTVL